MPYSVAARLVCKAQHYNIYQLTMAAVHCCKKQQRDASWAHHLHGWLGVVNWPIGMNFASD